MPATSKAQRRAVAIAKHSPGKLYKRNRTLLGMSKVEMRKYASTKEKGLLGKVLGKTKNIRKK